MKFKKDLKTFIKMKFFYGLLTVIPIATIVFTVYIVLNIDRTISTYIGSLIGFSIPYLGLLFFIIFIFLIGLLTTNIIGQKAIGFYEGILLKLPIARNIYTGSKQLIERITIGRKETFKKVVLIEYPRKGLFTLGFVTFEGENKLCNVFIPTTPKTVFGKTFIIPKKDIIELSISVEDGIKMILSGGIVTPENLVGVRGEG